MSARRITFMQKRYGGAVSTSVYRRSSSRPRCRLSHCSCWLTSQSCCSQQQTLRSSPPHILISQWPAQHLHTCYRAWLHANRPPDHRCTCADAAASWSLSTHLFRLFLSSSAVPEKHTAALLFLHLNKRMQSTPHTPRWSSCAAENCPNQTHLFL